MSSAECNPSPTAIAGSTGSDRGLVRTFQAGSEEAAEQLYRRYAGRLMELTACRRSADLTARFDPEDVVQSVFRTAFERLRLGLYHVPEGGDLWGLLLVLAVHKVQKLAAVHHASKRDARITTGPNGLDGAFRRDEEAGEFLRLVVNEVIEELPPAHRTIVRLRMESYEIAEIAARVERSSRTVERVLEQFRDRMGKVLEHENGDGNA
jgi:DNA-directed RNA polymerase specialized sigma24 family protein